MRVGDHEASERFYNTVLAQLGIDETYRTASFSEWENFMVTGAQPEHPLTRGVHVGFVSPTREQVDEFWRAGTEAGYTSDGEPGPRPQYGLEYYGAFLLDPDGHSVEAVHGGDRSEGVIDHIWIRVADLGAAKRFYETIAPMPASSCVTMGRIAPRSQEPAARSRSSRERRPRICTWRFPPTTTRTCTGSTRPPPTPGTSPTANRESAPAITPATTPPSCSTPTATTSRSSTTIGVRGAGGRLLGGGRLSAALIGEPPGKRRWGRGRERAQSRPFHDAQHVNLAPDGEP